MVAGRGLGNPGRAVVKLKLKNMYRLLLFRRTPVADHWVREAKTCKTHLLTFSCDEDSRDKFSTVSVLSWSRPCFNVLLLGLVFFKLVKRLDIFYIFLLLDVIVMSFAICLKTTLN